MNMNTEQMQVLNKNETNNILCRLFLKMSQKSGETNLESFFNHLKKKGNFLDKEDYNKFFDDLENIEINNIPIGYTNQNGIFIWNYCFNDVSEQILFPEKTVNIRLLNEQPAQTPAVNPVQEAPTQKKEENQMSPKKKGRGRPKGSRNKNNAETSPNRPVERAKEEVIPKGLTNGLHQEVVFMFTNSKGRTLPFNLEDAEKLIEQVKDIKQHLVG